MRTLFTAIAIPFTLIVAMLLDLLAHGSGAGIIIHPDAPHTVAFCNSPTSWEVVSDEAYPDEVPLVVALAAEVCPTIHP